MYVCPSVGDWLMIIYYHISNISGKFQMHSFHWPENVEPSQHQCLIRGVLLSRAACPGFSVRVFTETLSQGMIDWLSDWLPEGWLSFQAHHLPQRLGWYKVAHIPTMRQLVNINRQGHLRGSMKILLLLQKFKRFRGSLPGVGDKGQTSYGVRSILYHTTFVTELNYYCLTKSWKQKFMHIGSMQS